MAIPGRTPSFKQTIHKAAPLGDEHNPWWWNPTNPYRISCPDWFTKQLHELGEELECTWNPVRQRWQVWSRVPRIQHRICQGWRLLFIHQDADGDYLPLDNRVFARLYSASAAQYGDAKKYLDRLMSEHERDAEKRDERLKQEAIDRAMPHFEYSKIKNIGTGSKFSTYLS